MPARKAPDIESQPLDLWERELEHFNVRFVRCVALLVSSAVLIGFLIEINFAFMRDPEDFCTNHVKFVRFFNTAFCKYF